MSVCINSQNLTRKKIEYDSYHHFLRLASLLGELLILDFATFNIIEESDLTMLFRSSVVGRSTDLIKLRHTLWNVTSFNNTRFY